RADPALGEGPRLVVRADRGSGAARQRANSGASAGGSSSRIAQSDKNFRPVWARPTAFDPIGPAPTSDRSSAQALDSLALIVYKRSEERRVGKECRTRGG